MHPTNRVKVVTVICAHGHTHPRSVCAKNITNVWLPYTNMGNTLGAILRWELKIFSGRFYLFCVLVYTNHGLKCLPESRELH